MAKKFLTDINIAGGVFDSSGDIGSSGQVLSSTGSGVNWIDGTTSASIIYQDGFTGDGSTTAFTLANSIDNENKTQVYIDGVYQHKDTFSLNGTTLTFSTAPPNTTDIEVISFSSVSAADDILYDHDFTSAGLMTTDGSGVYSITTNNSANWNTAYGWGDHSTQSYATQSYVGTQISNLVDSSPATLDTLNELAAALGDDPNFATTTANSIGTKLPLAGGTMTGATLHGDSVHSYWGASNDLQIYHDGSNSYIKDTGTGDLILNVNNFRLKNAADSEIYLFAQDGGGVNLYHTGNAIKLQTTSTGVSVTGLMQASTVGVTNIVTNKVVKFNGSVLDDSNITDTGSLITLGSAVTAIGTLTVAGVTTLANVGYLGDGLGSVQYTLQSANNGFGTIDFGDVADANIGRLSYSHVDDSFLIRTNNATALTLDSSQNATFAGTIDSGTITSTGIVKAATAFQATAGDMTFFVNNVGEAMRIQQNTGNVGIGTSSPSDKLTIEDSGEAVLSIYSTDTGVVDSQKTFIKLYGENGLGTKIEQARISTAPGAYATSAGQLIFSTGSGVYSGGYVLEERIRIDESGNVGIGTSSPTANLDIVGTTGDVFAVTNSIGRYTINGYGLNSPSSFLITAGGSGYLSLDGYPIKFNIAGSEKMRLDIAGNVGIGTTAPSRDGLNIFHSTLPYVHLTNTTTGDLSSDGGYMSMSGTELRLGNQEAGGTLSLFTNNSTGNGITILSSGNVGIGTNTPNAPLQIASTNKTINGTLSGSNLSVYTTDTQAANVGASIGLGGMSTTPAGFEFYGTMAGRKENSTNLDSSGYLAFYTQRVAVGHVERMRIDSLGNVGIGTTSPQKNLHIEAAGQGDSVIRLSAVGNSAYYSDIINSVSAARGFAIQTQGTDAITIAGPGGYSGITIGRTSTNLLIKASTDEFVFTGGNVGIGTTSPGAKLQVNQTNNDIYQLTLHNTHLSTTAKTRIGNWVDQVKISSNYTQSGGTKTQDNTAKASWVQTMGDDLFDISRSPAASTTLTSLMTINSSGNVGIGVTSPTNYKLEVNGTVKGDSFSVPGASARIFAPSGAVYDGQGGQTGYLIVKLPDNGASAINNMMTGVIRVFDYTYHESFDVHFAGYWYEGYNWTNTTAWIDSASYNNRNFTVSFGGMTGAAGAGTRPYIMIGEAASTWSYCKFSVINYEPGHSNYEAYKWDSGWDMNISVTNPGTTQVSVSNTQVNNWARVGQDVYYGSGTGNVGIGNTSPSSFNSLGGKQVVIGDGTQTNNLTLFSATTGGSVGYGHIAFADSNTSSSSAQYAGLIQYYHGNDSMQFYTNATPRLTILNNGNVGIGTVNTNRSGLGIDHTVVTIGTDAGMGMLELQGTRTSDADLGRIAWLNAGTRRSEIVVSRIDENTSTKMSFRTSNAGSLSTKMTIAKDGNVGIGTITPRAKLEVVGDVTIQNGVYTYQTTGTAVGWDTLNFDITVNDEGGGGNVFKIEAGFSHYYAIAHASIGEWWSTTRGTSIVNTYILNAGSTNAGTWSASKPTVSILRITKSAGTYGGGGKYWVKVTYRPY